MKCNIGRTTSRCREYTDIWSFYSLQQARHQKRKSKFRVFSDGVLFDGPDGASNDANDLGKGELFFSQGAMFVSNSTSGGGLGFR